LRLENVCRCVDAHPRSPSSTIVARASPRLSGDSTWEERTTGDGRAEQLLGRSRLSPVAPVLPGLNSRTPNNCARDTGSSLRRADMGRRFSRAEHGVIVRGVKGTTFMRCARVRVELKTLLISIGFPALMSSGVFFGPVRSLRPRPLAGGAVEHLRPVSLATVASLSFRRLDRGVRGGTRPATVPFHVLRTDICRSRGESSAAPRSPA